MVLGRKNGRTMSRGQKIGIFRPCATAGRLSNLAPGRLGAHTGAGGQCAGVIEADVGADGPARILHTGTGSGGLRWAKGRNGTAFIMPDWLVIDVVAFCLTFS